MADPALLALLEGGTRRLVRTVDALPDDEWARPSLLPGWSRAHLVAHLALNAEALAGVLEGVREGEARTMYASQEARDADILELATVDPADLRDRFLGSTTLVVEGIAELPDNLAGTPVERVPGGRVFAAGDAIHMRTREVEIHHADLGVDYTAASWPDDFVVVLLGARAATYAGEPFGATATDLGLSWPFGTGTGPTVTGTGAALAWWATGRGSGDGLTSDSGALPRTEEL
jgi:maleylpyruvate isomerase